MKNKATINLINLAANSEEFVYEKIIINNNEYKIDKEKSINIDFDDFETEMGSKIVKCEFTDICKMKRYRYFEGFGENFDLQRISQHFESISTNFVNHEIEKIFDFDSFSINFTKFAKMKKYIFRSISLRNNMFFASVSTRNI